MRLQRGMLSVAATVVMLAPLLRAQAPTGYRADLIRQADDVEKKLVGLAEAVPAEKYGWRPAEGVRSVSEVYMHVVGANYLFPSMVGTKPPAGLSRDMEKTVTEKAKVIAALRQSFEHLRKAINSTSDADLDQPAKFFGRPSTVREIYLIAISHFHEHLGQSIAYARMNGVKPPWS